jgi:hypothetical protein
MHSDPTAYTGIRAAGEGQRAGAYLAAGRLRRLSACQRFELCGLAGCGALCWNVLDRDAVP